MQFVSIFPEGWKHVERCAGWITEIFSQPPHSFEALPMERRLRAGSLQGLHSSGSDLEMPTARHYQRNGTTGSTGDSTSEGDEDAPLQMTSMNGSAHAEKARAGRQKRRKSRRSRSGTRSPWRAGNGKAKRKDSDFSRLPSEEDLMQRRMQGLTFSLMGSDS